jgi:drug/metabolite transporter (DMT)-like permease
VTDWSVRRAGVIQVLAAILSLSITPILIKVGLAAQVDPVSLLTARLVVAAIALWVVVLVFRPQARSIDLRGLGSCALVALANCTSLLGFYVALSRIDASVAHVIFALYPAAALCLLALRGERIPTLGFVRLGLGLAGVYLLVGLDSGVEATGAALASLAAVAYALHLTMIQWRLGSYAAETVALYVITLMALFISIVRVVSFAPWAPLPPVAWTVVIITGLLSTVVARLLLFAGIRRIGSGQAALLGPFETLLTVIWATLFLGEHLSARQALGGILILGSALLAATPAATHDALQDGSPDSS